MYDIQSSVLCELGVTRLFGEGDIGETGLLSGWSYPEQGHVWNDGPESVLALLVHKPRGACRLTFEGEPFLHARHPQQDLVLHINGFRVGFWRLREERPYVLSAHVEPEQVFERRGGALLRCVWHLPLSVSPACLDLGKDGRELGFCFRSFCLEEVA